MLYGGAEGCRYFKSQQGSRRAAVASYSQAAPAVYARLLTRGLRAEVCAATLPRRHFGLSNSTAPSARCAGGGRPGLRRGGPARQSWLGKAVDEAGTPFAAKVTNVRNANSAVAEDSKRPGLPQRTPGGPQ
jgi:hypothetical protein